MFSAGLTSPDGVAFDAQGDVIVADTGNDIIRLIPAAARTVFGRPCNPVDIYTIAGNTNYGYTGQRRPGHRRRASAGHLQRRGRGRPQGTSCSPMSTTRSSASSRPPRAPTGPCRQGRRHLHHRRHRDRGLQGRQETGHQGRLDTPQGVAVDAAGNLFITDSANNLIRFVPAANGTYDGMAVKAGDIYTIAGNGAAGYTGNGGWPHAAELNSPGRRDRRADGSAAHRRQRQQRHPRDHGHVPAAPR